MTRSRYITIVTILILLQIVINLSLSISTYLLLAPVCFVLLGFERGITSVKCMLLAFAIGLIIDILSFGIPGLWSASLTAAAVPRLAIIRRRAWENDSGLYDMPTPAEMGFGIYVIFTLVVNTVFYLTYVMLERMTVILGITDGIRIMASVAVNTICITLISVCVQDNRRY